MVQSAVRFCRVLLIVSAMIAVIAVGFAHRVAHPAASPDMIAYLASGGSLSDVCGSGGSDGTAPVACEACRISDAAALLTTSGGTFVATLPKCDRLRVIAKRLAEARGLDPARLVRAPPLA
ncbi:hypothetical protein [uncultured Roseobacter sp.]|uniref:hypothetical protein n=1 Tax=uncultured Roseobacter sp. TaxID=114847 RepID=UPI00262487A0|nr:hypothetical protein [uncultured Roseobacter sp.]